MEERRLARILVVEDDVEMRVMVRESLEGAGGITVKACASGRQALRAAPGFRPDLILLDAVMPRMDGPATLRALRERPETAAVPVIFLTARSGGADADRFTGLGAIGVIAKPFNPALLAGAVRRFWSAAAPPPAI